MLLFITVIHGIHLTRLWLIQYVYMCDKLNKEKNLSYGEL